MEQRLSSTHERQAIEIVCVVMFLAAIVVANLTVSWFGQAALPFTAFCLIPFDLVTRDILHERWRGHALAMRMTALIGIGASMSALVSPSVALASFVAFASASAANAVTYELLFYSTTRWQRMNASNAVAAATDSIVFPVLAFAAVSPSLCFAQATSKFIGGLVLTAIFLKINPPR